MYQPPGTGMVSGPSGTAAGGSTGPGRLSTARLRTGAVATPGTTPGIGVSLRTDVQIADRPVTQQGMKGMQPRTRGPGRQVQDPSFFISTLNRKINEITRETNKLSSEMERHQREQAQYNKNRRLYEQLFRTVRDLEGTLADYNLARDKMRQSTDPEEVEHYVTQLRAKNAQQGQELDHIFMTIKEKERATNEIRVQIEQLHRETEERINRLDRAKLVQYKQQEGRYKELQQEEQRQADELNTLTRRIRELEGHLKEHSFRDEYMQEQRKMRRHEKERELLQLQMDIAQLQPQEAQSKMKNMIQGMRDHTKTVQRERDELQTTVQEFAERQNDNNRRSDAETSYKDMVDRLRQRDSEMTAFIEKFDETRADLLRNQEQAQEAIVLLLEHISQGLEAEHNIPSKERWDEMKDEASFKQRQLESSQTTIARLQDDHAKRVVDLEKINTLDARIEKELHDIHERMESMRAEIVQFEDIELLNRQAEDTKTHLEELKRSYTQRRDMVRQEVQVRSARYDELKREIQHSETAKALENAEKQMRYYEQNIFQLQEFIEVKRRETDFETVKENCSKIMDDLNVDAVRQAEAADKAYTASAVAATAGGGM